MLACQKGNYEQSQVDKNAIFITWIKRKKDEISKREQLSTYGYFSWYYITTLYLGDGNYETYWFLINLLDMLARALDFILNIGSKDNASSIPYEEPRNRDLRLFRNLNVVHEKLPTFIKKSSLNICTQCGHSQR